MKKKIYGMLVAASMLMLALGTTVEAVNDPQITGILESSKVQIKVDIEGDEKNVVTGENIEKEVYITNLGTECYIRITPQFSKNERDLANLVLGVSESWINLNGVYYYTVSLPENERIRFCTGVEIPTTAEGGDIDFGIKAEAIQSANFNPDFESSNPWGDVDILSARDENKEYEINSVDRDTKGNRGEGLEIYYNEDAKQMISNFDEIFSSVPNLHPGDSFTEVIELQNPTESEKIFYIADMTDESELLKHIEVEVSAEISGEMKNLYKGTLADDKNGEYLEVGTMAPGEGGKLIVEVSMGEDAGNEASGLTGHVALALDAENKGEKPNDSVVNTVRPVEPGKSETPVTNQPVVQWNPQSGNNQILSEPITENSSGNILNVSDNGDGKESGVTNLRSAKTGDDFNPGKGFVIAGVLLAAGLLLVLRPRKRIRR